MLASSLRDRSERRSSVEVAAEQAQRPKERCLGLCKPGAIKDLLQTNRTLRATFHPYISELVVYPTAVKPKEVLEGVPGGFPQDKKVTVARWNAIHPSRIPFINSTFGLFAEMDDWFNELKEGKAVTSTGEESRRERLELRGEDFSMGGVTSTEREEYAKLLARERESIRKASAGYLRQLRDHELILRTNPEEIGVFGKMFIIWHLCDLLHLKNNLDRPVASDLLEWVNSFFESPPKQDFKEIQTSGRLSSHPKFWPMVHKCIVRHHVTTAVILLNKLATEAPPCSYIAEVLIDLIRKMPIAQEDMSVNAFKSEFQEWREEVRTYTWEEGLRARLQSPEHFQNVWRAFKLLAGDEEALKSEATCWQELLAYTVLFVHPMFSGRQVADEIIPTIREDSDGSATEEACIALLEGDFHRAIRHCSKIDPWLVSHLTDILTRARLLDDGPLLDQLGGNRGDRCTLAESYLLTYAEIVLTVPSMWRVALEYFARCPRFGRAFIAATIPHIPLTSEFETRKVLSFCRMHGMETERRQIHKAVAHQRYREGRLGEAVMDYVEAGEHRRVAAIVDKLLDAYVLRGDYAWRDVAKAVPRRALYDNDRLSFLSHYLNFHELHNAKRFPEAAEKLVELFTSGAAPKRFWPTLLLDALPLLEWKHEVVVGVENTYELMRCLEEIITSHRKGEYLALLAGKENPDTRTDAGAGGVAEGVGEDWIQKAEKMLQVVRLALVRNLARAMMK
ncbi:Nucleoporin nup85 [Borealophlyctis nickersoniae]|nr:Nucleoporin nup85 [Borealophlyctis nickersoniae]